MNATQTAQVTTERYGDNVIIGQLTTILIGVGVGFGRSGFILWFRNGVLAIK